MTTQNTNNTNNKTQSEVVSDMKRREIGALWRKEGKASGQKFLTGHIKVDDLGAEKLLKVIIFSNKNKTNPKSPDFVIYMSRDDRQTQPSGFSTQERKESVAAKTEKATEENDEINIL